MISRTPVSTGLLWTASGLGFGLGAYAAYVGITWSRYGHPRRANPQEQDLLLDRYMPLYDVVERHHVAVAAPAAVTMAAARELDLSGSTVVRAIFKGRELILGAEPAARSGPKGLLAEVQSLGWVVLDETAGREMVIGAVTKPWQADVTFRSVPPDEFAAFDDPDYVKIAWTLRADPDGSDRSVFRTETRAVATSPSARVKFRRYWSFLSPGIFLIRQVMLGPVKAEAERRTQARAMRDGRTLSNDAAMERSFP